MKDTLDAPPLATAMFDDLVVREMRGTSQKRFVPWRDAAVLKKFCPSEYCKVSDLIGKADLERLRTLDAQVQAQVEAIAKCTAQSYQKWRVDALADCDETARREAVVADQKSYFRQRDEELEARKMKIRDLTSLMAPTIRAVLESAAKIAGKVARQMIEKSKADLAKLNVEFDLRSSCPVEILMLLRTGEILANSSESSHGYYGPSGRPLTSLAVDRGIDLR